MTNVLEDKEDFEGGHDSVIASLEKREQKKEASARDWNISHQFADMYFAGTNTREERVELERNLKKMIGEARFSYKYMEGYLISMGYQHDEIVRAFKHLTGIHPYDLQNPASFLATPPTIPGISLGWGQGKKGDYDYYFLNPYLWGFALFGQKGDINRDVVEMYHTSDQAFDGLKSYVKEAHIYDQPLTKDVMKDFRDEGPGLSTLNQHPSILLQADKKAQLDDDEIFTCDGCGDEEREGVATIIDGRKICEECATSEGKFAHLNDLGERAASIYEHLYQHPEDAKVILLGALDAGHITSEEEKVIRAAIERAAAPDPTHPSGGGGTPPPSDNTEKAVGVAEQLFKTEDTVKNQPFPDSMEWRSPTDFFEDQTGDKSVDKTVSENIDKILDYIGAKNQVLRNFKIVVSKFLYHGRELSEKLEETIKVPGQDIEEFFSSNFVMSVIVDVTDTSIPEGISTKAGLLVFVVADGNIVYDDVFKGEDGKIYALTEEGLSKYFFTERQHSHEDQMGHL